PVEQSASDTSSRFSVLSLTPVYLCVPCGSGFSSPPQRTQRNTGETLKHPPATAVLSSQLPPPAQEVRRFFAATSPALFPASRRATLSTIRHRHHEPCAPATHRLLLVSRRIRLSSPLREPLPPSASLSPARQAGSQVYFRLRFRSHFLPRFLQCTARTRDAIARRSCRGPASRQRQQSAAARAWPPEHPRQP